MDKELEAKLAKLESMDDQDWAAGVDWFDDSVVSETMLLRAMLVADNPTRLIKKMREDKAWADVVQRLSLLALDEIVRRSIRRRAE